MERQSKNNQSEIGFLGPKQLGLCTLESTDGCPGVSHSRCSTWKDRQTETVFQQHSQRQSLLEWVPEQHIPETAYLRFRGLSPHHRWGLRWPLIFSLRHAWWSRKLNHGTLHLFYRTAFPNTSGAEAKLFSLWIRSLVYSELLLLLLHHFSRVRLCATP